MNHLLELIMNEVNINDLVVKLQNIERMKRSGYWRMEHRYTESFVFIVLGKGQGVLSISDKQYNMEQENVYVCPPGESFGLEIKEKEEAHMYVLTYDMFQMSADTYHQLKKINQSIQHGWQTNKQIKLSRTFQISILCYDIYFNWISSHQFDHFQSQLLFQQLFYEVVSSFSMAEKLEGKSIEILDKTKAHMEKHYNQPFTIEQLARITGISAKYFIELFKKTYGISAMDYLNELRMTEAKKLLAQAEYKLKDIAHHVGYNDEFYFSRKFKQETGLSPSAYVAKRRKKVVAYSHEIMGQLVPLNIMPYAAKLHPRWYGYYYRQYRADIPVHLSAYKHNKHWEANIVKIANSHPDIIIAFDTISHQEKEELEQIAPVEYVSWEKGWREHLLRTANILEIEKEAQRWLQKYERSIQSVRKRLKSIVNQRTFLFVSIYKENIFIFNNRTVNDVIFNDLQIQPSELCKHTCEGVEVTVDQIMADQPDYIFVNVCQESQSLANWDSLQTSSQWLQLEAVQTNQVYSILSEPWREYSAYAHQRVIDELVTRLTENYPY